eukprot:882579-Alexandrium_andersonii.AAC.1
MLALAHDILGGLQSGLEGGFRHRCPHLGREAGAEGKQLIRALLGCAGCFVHVLGLAQLLRCILALDRKGCDPLE